MDASAADFGRAGGLKSAQAHCSMYSETYGELPGSKVNTESKQEFASAARQVSR